MTNDQKQLQMPPRTTLTNASPETGLGMGRLVLSSSCLGSNSLYNDCTITNYRTASN